MQFLCGWRHLPHVFCQSQRSVLLMILMKLRLNIQNQDIALRFGVSITHVGQILNDGLPALAKKLAFWFSGLKRKQSLGICRIYSGLVGWLFWV